MDVTSASLPAFGGRAGARDIHMFSDLPLDGDLGGSPPSVSGPTATGPDGKRRHAAGEWPELEPLARLTAADRIGKIVIYNISA